MKNIKFIFINIFLLALTTIYICCNDKPNAKETAEEQKIESFKNKIKHIVVIYQENWSFDGLYGNFPNSNNLLNGQINPQVKKDGSKSDSLTFLIMNYHNDSLKFPRPIPPEAFDLSLYIKPNNQTGDPKHKYYNEKLQIDNGKMDKFITYSNTGSLPLSYFNTSDTTLFPERKLAMEYTMCDSFFHSAYGGSFLNHIWLIAANTPKWQNPPREFLAVDSFTDNKATPDSFAVNTCYSINWLRIYKPKNFQEITKENYNMDSLHLLPILSDKTMPTIGDRLNDAKRSWAWYSGGWNDAISGNPGIDTNFQFHHQPFVDFENFKDEIYIKNKKYLKDELDLYKDVSDGNLPEVSFIKFYGDYNEHPGYTNIEKGQRHLAALIDSLMRNEKYRDSTAIIITYDENGGRWDHVAPPKKADGWGTGTRVPTIVISKYSKSEKGKPNKVDHTQYETVSILKLIETRFDLPPLSLRDSAAANMLNTFDFGE